MEPVGVYVAARTEVTGGVEAAAGVCVGGVDTEGDGESPTEGDGEEVVAVAFGPAKFDVGDDAAADGAHDERAEEFGEVGADGVHGVSFRCGLCHMGSMCNLRHLWNPEYLGRAIL